MLIKNKKVLVVVMALSVLPILIGGGIFLSNLTRSSPEWKVPPASIPRFSIAAGSGYSLIIMGDGSLWGWGNNGVGQLGDGTTISRNEPVRVMENVAAVYAGLNTTMMITSDGTLWTSGQLFYGMRHWFFRWTTPNPSTLIPTKIMDNVVVISLCDGEWNHAMAITSDGTLWGWGGNRFGQLGTGTTEDSRPRPARIMDDVIAVSAGYLYTMAITSDGTLWGWGYNRFGQLGDGTTENRHNPVKIMDDVIAVSAGQSRTFAITSNGALWGWGNNESGYLGDGTTENQHSPVKIMENVVAVSAGFSHTMAITSDGGLWAWGCNGIEGVNGFGQHGLGRLGDGTTTARHSPVRVMDNVTAVSAGSGHTLAVTSDGVLWAWGDNSYGQLGDGTKEDHLSPVRIMDNILIVE